MTVSEIASTIRQDVGFGLRQLIRSPGASLLAIVTLALGIGATTIVYSVVNTVVLEAVPFEDPDRLVMVRELTPQGDGFSTSDPNYLDWVERQRAFEGLGAYTLGDVTLTGGREAERLSGLRATHSLFEVLSVEPVAGRSFAPGEDRPGSGDRVVVLSEGFWERRYGRDEGLVGGSLVLDGTPHTVVGVVPTDRGFPGIDVFTPLRPDPMSDRGNHMLQVVGRLGPDATVDGARSDIQRVAAELAAEYPAANAGWSAMVIPFQEWRVGDRVSRMSLFLLLAVGFLLLMACGSVSAMLVARAAGREREIGLRAALGAGRRRIVGQLLTESALLGLLGGALGVGLAWIGTPAVAALGPADITRLADASMDLRVLAATLATLAVAVVAFGLAPALSAARGELYAALRGTGATLSRGRRRLHGALVVAQFALAIVVVLGAGLTVRSFARIQAIELGFEPEGVVRFSIGLPDGAFTGEERIAILDRLSREIGGLAGVEAVGTTMSSPFSDFQASNFVAPSEDVPDRQDDFVPISWRAVDGGFFAAAGVDRRAGRTFEPGDEALPPPGPDTRDFEPPIVIDATLARALWGDGDPVGRTLVWGDPTGSSMRVIGVVDAVRDESVQGDPRPRVYLPYTLFPWPSPSILVRAGADPAALVPAIRAILREVDPDLAMEDVATLPEVTREAVAWPRFTMQVVSGFGAMAVVLAALGIYGVASLGVQRRRMEIGIRVAMGAEPRRVVGLILREAARLAVVGIALGVLFALAVSGFLATVLYDVAPRDPLTFVVLPLALAAIALLASWIPARRATGVDPLDALSTE
jgi:putative ABC transport system permease protein